MVVIFIAVMTTKVRIVQLIDTLTPSQVTCMH